MISKLFINKDQALQKAKHFCAFQERCHSEVKEKLYSFDLKKNDVEEIISRLIEENFLNEERFAIQYAGGKFRVKQWGRVKIKYQLKQKQVSEYCIRKALTIIDDEQYLKTLGDLADSKLNTLKNEKNTFVKRKKLGDYLRVKGYEADLIYVVVNEVIK